MTLGSRNFAPRDYLTGVVRVDRPMLPGATVRAQIDIADPGAEAYGFELYACTVAERERLRCQGDDIGELFH